MSITCVIPGCPAPRLARGWCDAHYRRWRRHGNPLGGRHHITGCRITDCPHPHHAKGLCALHYERLVRHGDPEAGAQYADEVAVVRAVDGDRPSRLTTAEREVVVQRLHKAGLTDRLIADRLDIGTSGVWTIRQRHNLPANAAPVGDRSGRCAA